MTCMCGDTDCPSCGVAQGTLSEEVEKIRKANNYFSSEDATWKRLVESRLAEHATQIRNLKAPRQENKGETIRRAQLFISKLRYGGCVDYSNDDLDNVLAAINIADQQTKNNKTI